MNEVTMKEDPEAGKKRVGEQQVGEKEQREKEARVERGGRRERRSGDERAVGY